MGIGVGLGIGVVFGTGTCVGARVGVRVDARVAVRVAGCMGVGELGTETRAGAGSDVRVRIETGVGVGAGVSICADGLRMGGAVGVGRSAALVSSAGDLRGCAMGVATGVTGSITDVNAS